MQLGLDQAYKPHQPSRLMIQQATVSPYVGDSIYGTQDLVIIWADGLGYPYVKKDNLLTQFWNRALFPHQTA